MKCAKEAESIISEWKQKTSNTNNVIQTVTSESQDCLVDSQSENKEVKPTFTQVDKCVATTFNESRIIFSDYKTRNIF